MIMLPRPSAFLVKSEIYNGAAAAGSSTSPARSRSIAVRRTAPRCGPGSRCSLAAACSACSRRAPGAGQLASIQHGIGYLALHGKCPVVPVVCQGTAQALPKGKLLPRWRAPIDVVVRAARSRSTSPATRGPATTVAAAAEQVRLGLLAHLQAVSAAPSRSHGSGARRDTRPAPRRCRSSR